MTRTYKITLWFEALDANGEEAFAIRKVRAANAALASDIALQEFATGDIRHTYAEAI